MSRTLSSTALKSFYAAETGDFPIMLLTITAVGLTDPIRISSDPTARIAEPIEDIVYGTVSRGENYYFIPFQISLPGENDEASRASITIDNISRELVPTIRRLTAPPSVLMEMVMASSPNTVEVQFPGFSITSISYDRMTISGELNVEMLTSEPFPAGTFTPSRFPALF
jgi:hypothetical protein